MPNISVEEHKGARMYDVVTIYENNKRRHVVIEIPTGRTIEKFTDFNRAKKAKNALNKELERELREVGK